MQAKSVHKNVILTGIPRSGTTLTCHLLNKLPDCVALHEPLAPLELAGKDSLSLISFISDYFAMQRHEILQTGRATSKSFGGKVPDNPLAGIDSVTGKRIRVLDGREIEVNKPLTNEFCLAIKQPAFFTAILKDLVASGLFSCFAIVRNPLSVLLSWNTVEMPVSQGRVPAAEAFDPDLSAKLNSIIDIHDRQVFLLDWFFQKYIDSLPQESVVFYEKTIETGGKSISVIQQSAQNLSEPLNSQNKNKLYDNALKQLLLDKLLSKKDGAFWQFYSETEVLSLAAMD